MYIRYVNVYLYTCFPLFSFTTDVEKCCVSVQRRCSYNAGFFPCSVKSVEPVPCEFVKTWPGVWGLGSVVFTTGLSVSNARSPRHK